MTMEHAASVSPAVASPPQGEGHDHAAQAPASAPSPQSVGREFVRQYYTLLNQAPLHLHRFYSSNSSFVHGGLGQDASSEPVHGQQEIHKRIMALNFRDCHAKIRSVDAQTTIGDGVVVLVSGELSNSGQPLRRFVQTFVLAPQSPKKYYVLNDIFKYQDEVFGDEFGEAIYHQQHQQPMNHDQRHVAPQLQTHHEAAAFNVAGPAGPDQQQTLANGMDTKQQQPVIVSIQPKHTSEENSGVTVVAPGYANLNQVQQRAASPPTVSAAPPVASASVVATQANENSQEPEEHEEGDLDHDQGENDGGREGPNEEADMGERKTSGAATAASSAPVEGQGPSEPMSYATLVKAGTGSSQSAASAPGSKVAPRPSSSSDGYAAPFKTYGNAGGRGGGAARGGGRGGSTANNGPNKDRASTQQGQPQNESGSANAAQQQPQQPQQQPAQQEAGSGQDRRPVARLSSYGAAGNAAGGGVGGGLAAYYPDSQQVFVGNLPHYCTEEQLIELFSQFGKVAEIRINNKGAAQSKVTAAGNRVQVPNFGFVVFEEERAVPECLKNGPIYLPPDNHRLNVGEKKNRVRSDNYNYGGGPNSPSGQAQQHSGYNSGAPFRSSQEGGPAIGRGAGSSERGRGGGASVRGGGRGGGPGVAKAGPSGSAFPSSSARKKSPFPAASGQQQPSA